MAVLHPPSSPSPGAGRLPLFINKWKEVTTNSFVLSVVEFGLKIQFFSDPPILILSSGNFSPLRSSVVSKEVSILAKKTAIAKTVSNPDQFVSPIFDVAKKNSEDRRVILNLKILNSYILKTSFKLEGYEVIKNMIRPGDYFVSIDLRDAYLMLTMHPEFWHYLCFDWLDTRWFYRCMPFGLTSSPRIFTKIFKSVLIFLRKRGLRVSAWFDDIFLAASSIPLILEHLNFTLITLNSLGFLPHSEKSMLKPSQSILHLGFIWNSVDFTLAVPSDKVKELKKLCSQAMLKRVSLRFLNRILGTIENFRIAFPYAALHCRGIQRSVAYFISQNFKWDHKIILSESAIRDLQWWLDCPISLPTRPLSPFVQDITIITDSSETGWGGVLDDQEAYGFWSDSESLLHINTLETQAIYFVCLSLLRNVSNASILIKSDSTTAIAYINNLGGVRSEEIFSVISELYDFCIKRNLRIQASHIRGCLNSHADSLSRKTREHSYSIPKDLFSFICDKILFKPVIDLFASRLNHKLPLYFSEGPDPFANNFDAFVNPWPNSIYAFPPIKLVSKFIARFLQLTIEFGLLVCPF